MPRRKGLTRSGKNPNTKALPDVMCLHSSPPPQPHRISENHRYLVKSDGTPFFWLGDTAWELFHRLGKDEALHYLENRAALGYTVIQAVALAELQGLDIPNAQGHLPLLDRDPSRPNEDYFSHVDWTVNQANRLGLCIALLPTWACHWHPEDAAFTPENAEVYGEWIGRRYRKAGIVWVLGGDKAVENDRHRSILRTMARGVKRGDGGAHLITFHPGGGLGSAESFHHEPWLDFNMRQNGHAAEYTGRYDKTRQDYDREPVKPVLDAEPIYEDHPVSFDSRGRGHSLAIDTRRALYWDLFGGAFGHTYGHHSVWQMWEPGREGVNFPVMSWQEALGQPGAAQMRHARALLESRPFLTRIPDDGLIVPHDHATVLPGAGLYRFAGTRDSEGSFAMIYAPGGRNFRVRTENLAGSQFRAWWFNPRTGQSTLIGLIDRWEELAFRHPAEGEMIDWVLVLDDAARSFPPPGKSA